MTCGMKSDILGQKKTHVIFVMMEQQSLQCYHLHPDCYHCQLADLFHQLFLFFINFLLEFILFQSSCVWSIST